MQKWIKEQMTETALASVRFPKAEPFEHGVQVGIYSGLEQALNRIDEILQDEEG